MVEKKIKKYDADSIQTLSGLEHIQKRKGMYLSSIDGMFLEMFHNALDEVSNGYGNLIKIKLHKNGAWSCQDTGRGIPVGIDKKSGQQVQDRIFLNTNTGGKFNSDAFDFSIGLHGLGNKIITALSKYVKVEIHRNGEIWKAEYKNGGKDNALSKKSGKCNKDDTGTYIEFLVDEKYFEANEKIEPKMVKDHCLEISYLFPQLTIEYEDEINKEKISFQAKNGISEFINDNLGSAKIVGEIISIPSTNLPNGEKAELAFAWTNKEDSKFITFVNLLNMVDGGTHLEGFENGVYETIQNFALQNKDEKVKDPKFDLEDALSGMICCISTFVPEKIIKFQGQVKSKLLSPELKVDIRNLVIQNLSQWLKTNKDKGLKIIKNIYASRDARKAAERAKVSTKAMREAKKLKISDKFCRPAVYNEHSEVYICEGLSALGSLAKARVGINALKMPYSKTDKNCFGGPSFQGIFGIRGKCLNVQDVSLKQALANEEIQSIAGILDCGIGQNFNIKKLKYNKIFFASDLDPDGLHIQCLLITMFNKLWPELIKQGHCYIALSPFYVAIMKDGHKEFFWNEESKDKFLAKNKSKIDHLVHAKGLGENSHEDLRFSTMDPRTRTCIKVTSKEVEKCQQVLERWMGKNSIQARKEFITENVDFDKVTE